MLRRLYNWTLSLAATRHAERALFAISFAESSFFPIPPDVLMIPMVIANPSVVQARAISAPVTPVDVLPTLLDVAHAGTGAAIPDAIDALDGHSLWPAFSSRDTPLPERTVASEYLAEGTGAPMLMLREGTFKYTRCQTDPEQLFDPASDPHELTNLASATTQAQWWRRAQEAAKFAVR